VLENADDNDAVLMLVKMQQKYMFCCILLTLSSFFCKNGQFNLMWGHCGLHNVWQFQIWKTWIMD